MKRPLAAELRLARLSLGTWVGAALLGLFLLVALVGPLVVGHSPTTHDLDHLLEGPSAAHLLGTDESGSDLLTQICFGARLLLGLAAAVVSICLIRPLLGFREHSGAIGAADSQGNPSQASLRSSKTEARAATTASQLGKSYGFERRTVKHAIHFSLPSEIAVRADPNRRRFRPGPIVCVGAGEPAARCVSRRRRTSSRRDHERLFTRRSAAT